mmetsp:Transcript_45533/g.77343  ORF Transcript_45533/g.77343 Transcript_45533/m.77343 type:complete len:407 (+) Transcript_45533:20-1240(+)
MDPFAALLERAARTLPLNTPAEVVAIRELLSKLVGNIVANPFDVKYRTLKLSNKTLRTRLFDRHGAKEAMSVMGFKRAAAFDTGEDAMVLPFDPDEEPAAVAAAAAAAAPVVVPEVSVQPDAPPPPPATQSPSLSVTALEEAWAWLSQQLDSVLTMRPATASCCAECVLQLRLPTGATVKAGFFASEPMRSVQAFLNATSQLPTRTGGDEDSGGGGRDYSVHEKDGGDGDAGQLNRPAAVPAAVWVLQQAHPRILFSEPGQLEETLSALGLVPRATLIASLPAPTPSAAADERSAREKAAARLALARDTDAAQRRAREAALKKRNAKPALELKRERERLLGDFSADRADAKDRKAAANAAKAAQAKADKDTAEGIATEAVIEAAAAAATAAAEVDDGGGNAKGAPK